MNYKCKEGWLLSKSSTDGSLVPFFIHVLSKHVRHSLEDDFDSRIFSLIDKSSVTESNYSLSKIKVASNGWNVTINSDNTYNAIREISLNSAEFISAKENKEISAELSLPFNTADNGEFSVSTILNTDSDIFNNCITKVFITRDSNNISKIKLSLYNNSDVFPEDRSTEEFSASSIFITIKGNINFDA
jgi:hypothetical protein